ncbi:MAG: hypothetical protein JSR85_04795 [Proteobacteria bacterium]|nr:hypothetical protein [Pseudomonadota bacterium]
MKKLILELIAVNFMLNPSLEASYFIRNGVPAEIQVQDAKQNPIGTLSADSKDALTISASSFPITMTSSIDGVVSPDVTYTIKKPGCHIIWYNMETGSSAKLYSTPLVCP